jgi:hypothetical protein
LYVNRNGVVYPRTPCPTDVKYWQAVIGDRFVQLARMAPPAVTGLVFDTEMYGSEIAIYTDLCYCDVCWQQFTETLTPVTHDATYSDIRHVPANARFAYLQRQRLLQDYTSFQWNQVRTILREIVQRVRRIRPQMQFGFLAYAYTWFYAALVDGLGSPKFPALLLTESSYVRGYTPYVDVERNQIRKAREKIVRYLPGLWLDRFAPADVPSQLVDLALHADGYWIYPEKQAWEQLFQMFEQPSSDARVDYWSAIQQANAELNRLAHLPLVLYRKVPPVQQSSFYHASQRRLSTPATLRKGLPSAMAFMQASENVSEHSVSSLTYRGQTLFHCLPAEAQASFAVKHVPLGKHTDPDLVRIVPDTSAPISYLLFNGHGHLLQKGQITPSTSPQTISSIPGGQTMLSLLVDSGINGAQISFRGMSCVVEASSTFPLETYQSTFQTFLYVPSGTERLSFRAHSPQQESATITIRNGDRQQNQRVSTKWFTEFWLEDVFSNVPTLWSLQISPTLSKPFGDLRVYLYDAEFPYMWIPAH